MIGRVTGRATFDRLQRDGRRARRGPISVVFLPEPADERRFAFAISRAVGTAVVRNRLRRRLRSLLVELVREDASSIRPGTYLLSAAPGAAGLTYEDLKASVAKTVRATEGVVVR